MTQPQSTPAHSTGASVQLQVESFRSVRIEMVFCPEGPDTDVTTGLGANGMADGSAFIYLLDSSDHLVTARHNLTARHWTTGACMGQYSTNPTHLRVLFFADRPENWTISPIANGTRGQIQVLLNCYLVPLIGEDWQPIWKQHPILGADMDVAVVPFNAPSNTMIQSWERTAARTGPEEVPWPRLSPGHDVFIIGYPDRLSVGPILPL